MSRAFDIVFSSIALVLLSPVFLVMALLIIVCDRQSPIFSQTRIGRYGKSFCLYKFKTMRAGVENAELDKEDCRKYTTKLGASLRKTYIDELPQLINVFLGQMSFIGPRPITEKELDRFGNGKDLLLNEKPGLTGYWQVMRKDMSDFDFEVGRRQELELWWCKNHNIKINIWIIKETIKTIWKKTGI